MAASYQDKDKDKAKREKAQAGKDGKVKHLKGTFADEASAKRTADAELAEIQRQKATFSFTTAYGIPAISTESPVKLQGFKQQIDSLSWIVAKATHSYSNDGLTTQLELEAGI